MLVYGLQWLYQSLYTSPVQSCLYQPSLVQSGIHQSCLVTSSLCNQPSLVLDTSLYISSLDQPCLYRGLQLIVLQSSSHILVQPSRCQSGYRGTSLASILHSIRRPSLRSKVSLTFFCKFRHYQLVPASCTILVSILVYVAPSQSSIGHPQSSQAMSWLHQSSLEWMSLSQSSLVMYGPCSYILAQSILVTSSLVLYNLGSGERGLGRDGRTSFPNQVQVTRPRLC